MNRLLEKQGGMPLYFGDLTFIQNAIRDAIAGTQVGLNCVLWGCKLTQNSTNFEIEEGWVLIDGEVYYVPQHTVVGFDTENASAYDANNWNWPQQLQGNFSFVVVDSFNTDGSKTFKDTVTKDTYRVNEAKGFYQETTTLPSPGDADYLHIGGRLHREIMLKRSFDSFIKSEADTNTLEEYSYRYRVDSQSGLTLQSSLIAFDNNRGDAGITLTNGSELNASQTPEAMYDRHGIVSLRGAVNMGSGIGTRTKVGDIFNSAAHPPQKHQFSCATDTDSPGLLEITSAGEIYVNSLGSGTNPNVFWLNAAMYTV